MADEESRLLEGEWPYLKRIIVHSGNEAVFELWFNSPEYQVSAADPFAGAAGAILLARGLPASAAGGAEAAEGEVIARGMTREDRER